MMKKQSSNKDHVIEVASDLFLKNGYHLTSMDEVVKISNVSKSNIYYHFTNKEELAIGVLKWRMSQFEEQIQSIMTDSNMTIVKKLAYLYDLIARNGCENQSEGGCPFISLYLQASQQSNAIKKLIAQFFGELVPVIEKMLKAGVQSKEIKKEIDTQKTARFIISSLEGALMLSEITSDPQYMRDFSDVVPLLFN
jgi:AcrR family transcriptional regulator